MYVRQIESLNDDKFEIRLQLTLRLFWKDPRLSYASPLGIDFITLRDTSALWLPDIFFTNERTSSRAGALHPSTMIRLFPDGHILYSSIVSLVLYCPHDFSLYPFDEPGCSVKIASYGYTTKDLILVWKEVAPVQVAKGLGAPTLSVHATKADDCTSLTNTGEYSCIRVFLSLKRISRENLVRTYIPSSLFVIVSYLAFWLKEYNQRLLLTSVTLLVFSVNATLNQSNRPSQLITTLDIWVGACISFSFIALILVILLDYYDSRQGNLRESRASNRLNVNDIERISQKDQLVEETPPQVQINWLQERMKQLRQINFSDQVSLGAFIRVAYPLSFGIFTLIYTLCVNLL